MFLLFTTAAVITAVLIWQLAWTADSPSERSNSLSSRTPEARTSSRLNQAIEAAKTARLEHQMSSLEADLPALSADQGAAGSSMEANPRDGMSRPAAISGEEDPAHGAQEEAGVFAQIGDTFSSQAIDQAWSTSMTRRLHEQVRLQPLDEATLDKVECRSSACRIEISASDGADLGSIRDSIRASISDILGTGASKRDDGGKYVLYLGKDPESLGLGAN